MKARSRRTKARNGADRVALEDLVYDFEDRSFLDAFDNRGSGEQTAVVRIVRRVPVRDTNNLQTIDFHLLIAEHGRTLRGSVPVLYPAALSPSIRPIGF